jgi:hypothetical protein
MRSTLLVSALLASVSALAAPPSLASVLDADAYTIGAGRTPLPPADVYEIARLARAIK